MIRIIAALAAGAALTAASAAPAATTTEKTNAAKECRALQKQLGATTFKDTYGTNASKSNAFGKCVSAKAKVARTAATNAAEACRAEGLAPDTQGKPDTTGKPSRNPGQGDKNSAFGKCVSQKARAEAEQDRKDTVNAAKQCKAERRADAAKFATDYGTRPNAFGKCVSAKAKAKA